MLRDSLILLQRDSIVLSYLKIGCQPVYSDLRRAVGRGAMHFFNKTVGNATEPRCDVDNHRTG